MTIAEFIERSDQSEHHTTNDSIALISFVTELDRELIIGQESTSIIRGGRMF